MTGTDGYRTPTYADRLICVRTFPSDPERQLGQARLERSWPHIRPDSCLVAAMANHWKEGCWQKTIDMVQATNKAGRYCAFSEIQDRCFNPFDAIGTMRNEALLDALNEGFEWLLYVDNDVMPEPDTLLRLLQWDMPIVVPYVVEPGTGKPLHGPLQQPNTGLRPIRWAVLSMLLFRVAVFNCIGPHFWRDAMGADEGWHFKQLWHYGHRPYMDTSVQLVVAKTPTYPLSTNRMTWERRQAYWKDRVEQTLKPPDRRPIDPADPRVIDGEYMPFIQPAPGPRVPMAGGTKPTDFSKTWTRRNGNGSSA